MRILLLMLALASPLFPTLSAATVTWNGNNSTAWNDPSNWDCACLPTPEDDVIIPIGSFVDLADDADLQIRSLTVRGNLFIEDGSTLRIDSQNDESNVGLTLAAGNMNNSGTLVITNTNARNALYINAGAAFTNGGAIQIGQIRCLSENCSLQDVVVVDGTFDNTGTLTLAGVLNMEGFVIRGSVYNAGTIQVDTIFTTGSVMSLSQGGTFVNAANGALLLSGIEGENLTRAIANTQDSVSWENAGTIQIRITDPLSTGISLGGEGTIIRNTGLIEIDGGGTGLRLTAPDQFLNQGTIRLRGQQHQGVQLSGVLAFQNEGHLVLQSGAAEEGFVFAGANPGPQLLNTGMIRMQDYLQASNFNRGMQVSTGRIVNEGDIHLAGAGDGRGIEVGTAASALENRVAGTIYLNHFDFGLYHEIPTTNLGTMILADGLGEAIVDNDVPLMNSGTLGGGSIYRDGLFDLMATTILSPGTDSTVSRQSFGGDLLLPETVIIELDLANTLDQPDANDNVRSSRAFQFSGVLNVRLTSDFALSSGSFELLKGSGSAGGFTGEPTINLPNPPEGSNWRLEQTATRIILHLDVINSTQNPSQDQLQLLLYPNPASAGQDCIIDLPVPSEIAKLYNLSGRLIKMQPLEYGQNRFSTAGLETGYYVLVIGKDRVPVVIH